MKRKELLLGIPVAAIAIVCIVCIVCVVCSGCNSFHGRQRATHGGDNSSADTLQGSPRELPLPEGRANDFSPARHGLATHAEKAEPLPPAGELSRETLQGRGDYGA